MINNNLIININGVYYSKVILDEVVRNTRIVEIHGTQSSTHDKQWYDVSFGILADNEDVEDYAHCGCAYGNSLEGVAEASGLDIYEVALRYLNGHVYSYEHVTYTDTWEEEFRDNWG